MLSLGVELMSNSGTKPIKLGARGMLTVAYCDVFSNGCDDANRIDADRIDDYGVDDAKVMWL